MLLQKYKIINLKTNKATVATSVDLVNESIDDISIKNPNYKFLESTGFIDMFDTMIFDGDILKTNLGVNFEVRKYKNYWIINEENFPKNVEELTQDFIDSNEAEIIGNLYY
jgi:yopX protein